MNVSLGVDDAPSTSSPKVVLEGPRTVITVETQCVFPRNMSILTRYQPKRFAHRNHHCDNSRIQGANCLTVVCPETNPLLTSLTLRSPQHLPGQTLSKRSLKILTRLISQNWVRLMMLSSSRYPSRMEYRQVHRSSCPRTMTHSVRCGMSLNHSLFPKCVEPLQGSQLIPSWSFLHQAKIRGVNHMMTALDHYTSCSEMERTIPLLMPASRRRGMQAAWTFLDGSRPRLSVECL
jgi:hypothetical protein